MSAVVGPGDEINREHDLARRHARDAVKHAIRCGELLTKKKAELRHGEFTLWIRINCKFKHAIRCGELLTKKKAELRHGEFTLWIRINCKFKQATANNYMKAAQNPNALGDSIRHLFPSGKPGASAAHAAKRMAVAIANRAPAIPTLTSDSAAVVARSKPTKIEPVTFNDAMMTKPATAKPENVATLLEHQSYTSQLIGSADRDADLERVKAAITDYAEKHGWGAAAVDLVTWIEEQGEAGR